MTTQSPGEDLIDTLDDLRKNLNLLREELAKSGVERTKGLRDTMGADCKFYRKSLDLFLRKDYLKLRATIKEAERLFNLIEGENVTER